MRSAISLISSPLASCSLSSSSCCEFQTLSDRAWGLMGVTLVED